MCLQVKKTEPQEEPIYRASGTPIYVYNTGQGLSCIAPGVPTPPYNGYVDQVTCTTISGWTWNSQQPDTPINVDVYSDGAFLTSVPANQFRQDLRNAGIGNGVHGFSLATPNSLKNAATQTHFVSLHFPGTTLDLNGSPWALTCTNAQPAATLTAPAQNGQFTAPATITLAASASDADGTIAKVEFFDGATLVGTAAAAPYSVTLANVAAGAHAYTARATDNKGGTLTSAAVNVIVNVAPTVSITAPASHALYNAPASVAIGASAADTDGTIARVDFYQGATLLGSAPSAPYGFTWANVAAGSYSLTAVATDDRGTSTTSAVVAITVSGSSGVSLTAPADGAVFAQAASITLTASAVNPQGSIAKVDFYQGATLLGTATTAPYSVSWSGAASGSYALTAVATDGVGGTTTSSVVSIRVNTAPTVNLTSPTGGANFTTPANIAVAAN